MSGDHPVRVDIDTHHELPARFVSCLVSGSICTLEAMAIWKYASISHNRMNLTSRSGLDKVWSKYEWVSSGSTSSRWILRCVPHISVRDHVVEEIIP
jgi:hypothetical protein